MIEIRQKIFLICLILAGLSACALMGSPIELPEADGAKQPDSEVGILDYSWVARFVSVYIDGVYASGSLSYAGDFHGYARLTPGDHTIVCKMQFSSGRSLYEKMILRVEAGHRYRLDYDSCYWCKSFRAVAWIVDENTGEIVAGHYPDWPAWML